jgi:hypothetical protein
VCAFAKWSEVYSVNRKPVAVTIITTSGRAMDTLFKPIEYSVQYTSDGQNGSIYEKSNFTPLAHIFNDTLSQLLEKDVEKHSQELSNMVSLVTIDTNCKDISGMS